MGLCKRYNTMASVSAAGPMTASFTHYVHGSMRSFLGGAGLCYAINKREYLHVPLVIIFPSAYVGYHLFKNKDSAAEWVLSGLRFHLR